MSVPGLEKFVKLISEDKGLHAKTLDAKVFMKRMKGQKEPAAIKKAMKEDLQEFVSIGKENGCDFTVEEAGTFFAALKAKGELSDTDLAGVAGGAGGFGGLVSVPLLGHNFMLSKSFLDTAKLNLAAGW